ncbi:hypothetical protein PHBOTO_005936 [Pseudozyma hubeiensis]|nr:hypothetical protein PHBOTO_005936 [Pseudozyma hubeiensis]
MLGFVCIGYRGITNPRIVITLGLPLGMIGNFAASMFAFASGSTFIATLAGTLAGLIGGASFLFLPWTGIQATYLTGAANQAAGVEEFYKAAAMVFFIALIPIFLVFLASLRTSGPSAGAALFIVIALGCLGGGYIGGAPNVAVLKASGAFFILVGILLFYSALSVMLAEEGLKILPVFPLPRLE